MSNSLSKTQETEKVKELPLIVRQLFFCKIFFTDLPMKIVSVTPALIESSPKSTQNKLHFCFPTVYCPTSMLFFFKNQRC